LRLGNFLAIKASLVTDNLGSVIDRQ